MQQSKCQITLCENELVVRVLGEIDHHSAAPLREEIDRAIFKYRAEVVKLDLSSVSFMDSAGLGLILGRFTRITDLGGKLVIVNPSDEIDKILKLAGVRKLINVQTGKEAIL